MRRRILHLSDTHVSATGPDASGADGVAALSGLLEDLRHVRDLDLIMISGDVADDGSAQGCATVRDLIADFAQPRHAAQVYCTGNHDRRDGFTAALGSGHLSATGEDIGQRGVEGRCAAVSEIEGLRLITLDSLIPGRTEGELDQAQLDWLGSVLSAPTPEGTVLMLHHPPLASPLTDFMGAVVLQGSERLTEVLVGGDVQIVLSGHLHHQVSGFVAGVPAWTTPGVVSRIDLTAPPSVVRGVRGAGATIVELGGPYGPVCQLVTARDPRAGEELYEDKFGA